MTMVASFYGGPARPPHRSCAQRGREQREPQMLPVGMRRANLVPRRSQQKPVPFEADFSNRKRTARKSPSGPRS